jgi:peptidoglycan/LPS O-acetylase OafA/YrhL
MLHLNSFRRVTSGKAILEEIDGLRFLAIFYVIIAHLHGFFVLKTPFFHDHTAHSGLLNFVGSIGKDGKHGVAIFFVISGFILALPFAKQFLKNDSKPISLKQYYLRRLTRLEPPYIIALIILTIAIILKNINSFQELFPHLVASLTYTHTIMYDSVSWISPVTWSLEVEVQFYLLAPFLALIFTIRNFFHRQLILCSGIVLFACLQEVPLFKDSFALSMSLPGWFQYFLAGFILADIYISNKITHKISRFTEIGAGVLLLYGLSFLSYEGGILQRLMYPAMCFLFFVLVLHFPFWKKVFSIPWISVMGGMCYSIYLLHFAVISFIGNYSIHYQITNSLTVNYILQWVLIFSTILAVSAMYFILIEKPCMRKDWPSSLFKKVKSNLFLQPGTAKG